MLTCNSLVITTIVAQYNNYDYQINRFEEKENERTHEVFAG